MRQKNTESRKEIPEMFRPLLWWLRWDKIDAWDDRRNIIMGTLTNGRLDHMRWIIKTYGIDEIKKVLSHSLETEFHPGARNLARVLFGVAKLKHAR